MSGFVTLQDFLAANRADLLQRWTQRVARDLDGGDLSHVELLDHMPQFLDELIECLRGGPRTDAQGLVQSDNAPDHGLQRLRVGFDVDEVVREYGLLADVIFQAVEAAGRQIDAHEARIFQAQLNAGAAEAVAAYIRRRDDDVRRQSARHRSFIAHELRTPLGTAATALAILRRSLSEPMGNEAVELLGRNLTQLRDLIDQVLTEGRLDAGAQPECSSIDLAELVRQVIDESTWLARSHDVRLVAAVPETVPAVGDRRLLLSTLANLVRNAVKYSHPGAEVLVSAATRGDELVVEVTDGCGGFEPKPGVDVFEPFVQAGDDRTGFGLGLAIAKQAAKAHGGDIVFRNAPPTGCVFTLTLPADGPPACP